MRPGTPHIQGWQGVRKNMGLRNRDTRFARWAFSHAASFFWLVCGAVGQTPQRNPAPDVSGTQIAQLTQRAAALDAQLTETRVMLAAVQLQFALAHGRPFPREWATLRDLAPPALLSNGMREPLTSHAARGVPAPAELRAGLAAQRDALLARSETGGWMDWAQGAMARFGLWDARVESSVAPVLQRMNQQLARGQIGAALTEAEALGPAALSALSAWLAQTRIVADGVVIAEHGRRFGRDPLICHPPRIPGHYLPILERNPEHCAMAYRSANGICRSPFSRFATASSSSPRVTAPLSSCC